MPSQEQAGKWDSELRAEPGSLNGTEASGQGFPESGRPECGQRERTGSGVERGLQSRKSGAGEQRVSKLGLVDGS